MNLLKPSDPKHTFKENSSLNRFILCFHDVCVCARVCVALRPSSPLLSSLSSGALQLSVSAFSLSPPQCVSGSSTRRAAQRARLPGCSCGPSLLAHAAAPALLPAEGRPVIHRAEAASLSMNMACIGDADPFTAAIPATKVELTVSCR